jgi:acetylglutamate kinase
VAFFPVKVRGFLVDEAIRKAEVLIEALAWIRRFRGRHVVIKLGGSALEEREAVRSFLTDVIFLQSVGLRPILVHGGGKDIDKAMAAAGITPRKVQGRRYTDAETLEIVAKVLAGEICGGLVAEMRRQSGNAIGLSFRSQNCLIGKKLELPGADGQPVDLGFVGEVIDIDRGLLEDVCAAGIIPVIPSVAMDSTGQLLNVNADTAAAAIARILKAEKLIFVSDVPGIFLDRKNPATLQSNLTAARCRELIREGIIDAGMVPKVDAALEALNAGVGKVHIVDGRMPHSVLLEIYSDTGVGTEIVL